MKEVDIGNESFADMINNDSYYVDKTSFIIWQTNKMI